MGPMTPIIIERLRITKLPNDQLLQRSQAHHLPTLLHSNFALDLSLLWDKDENIDWPGLAQIL